MRLNTGKTNTGKEAAARILIAAAIFAGILITGVALGQRVIQEKSEAFIRELAKKPQGWHREEENVSDNEVSGNTTKKGKEETGIPIDFEKLQEFNPDIKAWITVPYSTIDYPVLCATKEEGEDYYLRRDYRGEKNNHGSIYIQTGATDDFTGRVTILYGHNMKDGSMFGALHAFLVNPKGQNQSIMIYLPDRAIEGKLIACYETDDSLLPDKFGNFRSAKYVLEYINSFENTTDIFPSISNDIVNGKYNIVTLSTCTKAGEKRVLAQYAIPNKK